MKKQQIMNRKPIKMHEKTIALIIICFGLASLGIVSAVTEPHPDNDHTTTNEGEKNTSSSSRFFFLRLRSFFFSHFFNSFFVDFVDSATIFI